MNLSESVEKRQQNIRLGKRAALKSRTTQKRIARLPTILAGLIL